MIKRVEACSQKQAACLERSKCLKNQLSYCQLSSIVVELFLSKVGLPYFRCPKRGQVSSASKIQVG